MAEAEMRQNVTKNRKKLSAKREKAANLVSEDFLTDEKIAAEVGVTRQTLARWKDDKAFTARVEQISDAFAERALNHGLARRAKRLALLNEHHDNLLQVIAERKRDPELANVPGGKTGLVTKTVKGIGKGDDYRVVDVFEVDTATIREMRQIYEQVAEELGQKTNKLDITERTVPFDPVQATDEEIIRFILNADHKVDGGLSDKLHELIYQHCHAGEDIPNNAAAPRTDKKYAEPQGVISAETIARIQSGTVPDVEDGEAKEAER